MKGKLTLSPLLQGSDIICWVFFVIFKKCPGSGGDKLVINKSCLICPRESAKTFHCRSCIYFKRQHSVRFVVSLTSVKEEIRLQNLLRLSHE